MHGHSGGATFTDPRLAIHSWTAAFRPRAVRFCATRWHLIGLLLEDYASPVSWSVMAAVVGVSIRRMQDAVNGATGHTPSQLLREIRLEAAHRVLCQAGAHVTAVAAAHACGIAHLGPIAVQNRPRFGCSPSATLQKDR